MKVIQETVGKTQQQIAVPDMQQECLYQVEISYHNFKCLQTEREYQIYKESNETGGAGATALAICLLVVVFLIGFVIGKANG